MSLQTGRVGLKFKMNISYSYIKFANKNTLKVLTFLQDEVGVFGSGGPFVGGS